MDMFTVSRSVHIFITVWFVLLPEKSFAASQTTNESESLQQYNFTTSTPTVSSYHPSSPPTLNFTSTHPNSERQGKTETDAKDTGKSKMDVQTSPVTDGLATYKTSESTNISSMHVRITALAELKNSSDNTSAILNREEIHPLLNESKIPLLSTSTATMDYRDLPSRTAALVNESSVDVKEFTVKGSEGKCVNCTSPNIAKSRQKKHMHAFNTYAYRQRFYNYKLLYNTLRNPHDVNHKQTEFYAWIFGATMLTLGSLTTMASCFVFCVCGDRWRERRSLKYSNKDFSYERVDSVTSVVTII